MNPLTLIQLQPNLLALGRWAAATGQPALRQDPGYALHAAARAALGAMAPKPFVLQQRMDGDWMLGYVPAAATDVERAITLLGAESEAAGALGVHTWRGRELPCDWRSGERLRFEVKAAPVVRSRMVHTDSYCEQDAAFHPKFGVPDAGGSPAERSLAYGRWLAQELARQDAATLLHHELSAFSLGNALRRHTRQSEQSRPQRLGRLPEATLRGVLQVRDGVAFHALLARGIGRHRAFGFGCLLLAPA